MTDLVAHQADARRGICPLCGSGPWRGLAHHVAMAHKVPARELKRRLDIPVSHGLNDPELTEHNRATRRALGAPPELIEAARTSRRSAWISNAGRAGRRAPTPARTAAIDARRKIPLAALPELLHRHRGGERLRDLAAEYGASAAALHHAFRQHSDIADPQRTPTKDDAAAGPDATGPA